MEDKSITEVVVEAVGLANLPLELAAAFGIHELLLDFLWALYRMFFKVACLCMRGSRQNRFGRDFIIIDSSSIMAGRIRGIPKIQPTAYATSAFGSNASCFYLLLITAAMRVD